MIASPWWMVNEKRTGILGLRSWLVLVAEVLGGPRNVPRTRRPLGRVWCGLPCGRRPPPRGAVGAGETGGSGAARLVRCGGRRYRPGPVPADAGPGFDQMAQDAVVPHHSALDLWGISHSLWFDAVYSATEPRPPLAFRAMRYRGARFPPRLIESGDPHFGVVEQTYADGTVRVTGMERTLVDVLADPDYGGSWDEIYQSVTRADSIDLETVAAYCQLRDGSPALRAKVGSFLDQHRELWGISASDLDQFRPPGSRGGDYIAG